MVVWKNIANLTQIEEKDIPGRGKNLEKHVLFCEKIRRKSSLQCRNPDNVFGTIFCDKLESIFVWLKIIFLVYISKSVQHYMRNCLMIRFCDVFILNWYSSELSRIYKQMYVFNGDSIAVVWNTLFYIPIMFFRNFLAFHGRFF